MSSQPEPSDEPALAEPVAIELTDGADLDSAAAEIIEFSAFESDDFIELGDVAMAVARESVEDSDESGFARRGVDGLPLEEIEPMATVETAAEPSVDDTTEDATDLAAFELQHADR